MDAPQITIDVQTLLTAIGGLLTALFTICGAVLTYIVSALRESRKENNATAQLAIILDERMNNVEDDVQEIKSIQNGLPYVKQRRKSTRVHAT